MMNMPALKFTVEKLGSINSGEFQQKPLTIFCGPNNSGKTWAMYSLYHFYWALRMVRLQTNKSVPFSLFPQQ